MEDGTLTEREIIDAAEKAGVAVDRVSVCNKEECYLDVLHQTNGKMWNSWIKVLKGKRFGLAECGRGNPVVEANTLENLFEKFAELDYAGTWQQAKRELPKVFQAARAYGIGKGTVMEMVRGEIDKILDTQ